MSHWPQRITHWRALYLQSSPDAESESSAGSDSPPRDPCSGGHIAAVPQRGALGQAEAEADGGHGLQTEVKDALVVAGEVRGEAREDQVRAGHLEPVGQHEHAPAGLRRGGELPAVGTPG